MSDSEFRPLVATPLQRQRDAEGQFKIVYARLCFTRQGIFLLGVTTMVGGSVGNPDPDPDPFVRGTDPDPAPNPDPSLFL